MYRTAILLPLLLLAGCSLLPASNPQLQLEQHYQVEWIGERPLIDRSYLSLILDRDGRAFGHAGCNQWFGNYQLDGNRLSIERIATTRKLCAPALMEQEHRFLDALPNVERWDFSTTGQLQLWPATGSAIRLWPEPAPAIQPEHSR